MVLPTLSGAVKAVSMSLPQSMSLVVDAFSGITVFHDVEDIRHLMLDPRPAFVFRTNFPRAFCSALYQLKSGFRHGPPDEIAS